MRCDADALLDIIQYILIGRHILPRQRLFPDGEIFHLGPEVALTPDGCDGEFHVGGMGEVVGVDQGRMGGVRRGDGHRAAGKGVTEERGNGRVVVAVRGVFFRVVALVAERGTEWEVFDLMMELVKDPITYLRYQRASFYFGPVGAEGRV